MTSRPTRASALKRDSLAAELERDPKLSSAKRQQRKNELSTSVAQAILERDLHAAQTGRATAERRVRECETAMEKLEQERRVLADREQAEREAKEEERKEFEADKSELLSEVRTLRHALGKSQSAHDELHDDHDNLRRTTTHTIASQASQISTLERQIQHLTSSLASAQLTSESSTRTAQDLQSRIDDLTSKYSHLTLLASDHQSMSVVQEELHRQTSYIRSLEAKNVKLSAEVAGLRDRATSVAVLKEEKRGLEKQIENMDQLRAKVVKLEAEVEAARQERRTSTTEPAKAAEPSSAALRLAHASLLEEHGATVAQLRSQEIALANIKDRESESTESISHLQAQNTSLQQMLDRHQHNHTMDQREIQFLKALVASYKAEQESESPDAQAQLETLLAESKSRILELTSQLDTRDTTSLSTLSQLRDLRAQHTQDLTSAHQRSITLETQLQDALRANETHLTKVDALEQELFELTGEMAGGRHVPPNTRVLSMKDNPEQQWFDLRQEVMDRIKRENEALLKRLKELEERGVSKKPGDQEREEELVPRTSYELVCAEKKDLEEVVRQRDKRLVRLKDLYASKSREFREAVRFILGVKIIFYPNGQVRITSIYDVNATFVFQPSSSSSGSNVSTMQLVAQGELAPEDIPEMMRYWIGTEECVPGFMAALTLQCYENWEREGEERGDVLL